MLKSDFDLPRTDADFQIHDHGYWRRAGRSWWRAAWIQPYGQRFAVMYVTRQCGAHHFAGYFDSLDDAVRKMTALGRKAKA